MNQTPPISPVVKLKLKELGDKKLLRDHALNSASTKLQSLLDEDYQKKTVMTDDDDKQVTLTKSSEDESISDRLSELISQLIPLHKMSPVTLSSDSIFQIISVLNLTITFLQSQENLLNLLKLNCAISKEQYDVEKEILVKELEVMRMIHDRQRNDIRRRYSEPTTKINNKRKLRAAKKSQENTVESDVTISDTDDLLTENKAIVNKAEREEDYHKLIGEINKNQKLFIHNKFGYYYNTLNGGKGNSRKRRLSKKLT